MYNKHMKNTSSCHILHHNLQSDPVSDTNCDHLRQQKTYFASQASDLLWAADLDFRKVLTFESKENLWKPGPWGCVWMGLSYKNLHSLLRWWIQKTSPGNQHKTSEVSMLLNSIVGRNLLVPVSKAKFLSKKNNLPRFLTTLNELTSSTLWNRSFNKHIVQNYQCPPQKLQDQSFGDWWFAAQALEAFCTGHRWGFLGSWEKSQGITPTALAKTEALESPCSVGTCTSLEWKQRSVGLHQALHLKVTWSNPSKGFHYPIRQAA